MKTIYLVPIEPIDSRYTKQWYENIPKLIQDRAAEKNIECPRIVTIDGTIPTAGTTTGAFLDFAATNIYKASQAQKIAELFQAGEVQPGDKFLVTDAWNFVITPIKYMSDLLGIPVEIHGIWHAGAYDPTDILGMKMSKPWPAEVERSWFYSCDWNYYATDFHRSMFLRNLDIPQAYHNRAIRSGQPHEPIIAQLEPYINSPKKAQVMWPHRYNADKQPDIAEDLAGKFNMIITQKMNLSKSEYYEHMGSSQVIFSCALHENLGISIMEAVLAGCIPVLPDRASYHEMYLPEFKYPSEWTSSHANYLKYKTDLVYFMSDRLNRPEAYALAMAEQRQILKDHYLTANIMIDNLLAQR